MAPPPPAPHHRDPDARRHDGFYLRAGVGFGGYHQYLEGDVSPEVKGRVSGIASLSEFALGGTISRGFVLGVGLYGAAVLASNYHPETNAALPAEFVEEEFSFDVVGPFFDYYFDEHKGLHLQVALGFASYSGIGVDSTSYDEDQYKAFGGGVMVGFGHDWWVADQWSVGVLGRGMLGVVVGDDDAGNRWTHVISTSPSILFTVTYH